MKNYIIAYEIISERRARDGDGEYMCIVIRDYVKWEENAYTWPGILFALCIVLFNVIFFIYHKIYC